MPESTPLTSQNIWKTEITPAFVVGTRQRIKSAMPGIMSNAFGPLRDITAAVLTLLWWSERLSTDTMNMVQSVIAERNMQNSAIQIAPAIVSHTWISMMAAANDPKFEQPKTGTHG